MTTPRRILLTGASSGIGRELALHLAREGHRLALSARRAPLLADLAREFVPEAPMPLLLPCDVTNPAAVEAAVQKAQCEMGPLDTLVYSAGAARFDTVEETTDEVWSRMLSVNLTGLFHAVRAVLPLFRANGRGHILAVLSISSRVAYPRSAAYTAAKFGALGFIDSLRAELRPAGIHVTAVLPGATDTPIWDDIGGTFDRSRMMRPEQVARLITSALRETTSGMVEEIRVGPVGGAL
jgi:short-subunit dehydrogenase